MPGEIQDTAVRAEIIKRLNNGDTLISIVQELDKQGIKATRQEISAIKQNYMETLDKEMRDEYLSEKILDSYEKAKIEFEDTLTRTKRYLEEFENQKDFENAMLANREIKDQVTTALKAMGKFADKVASIQAKNINVLNISDFSSAMKRTMNKWFTEMEATYENGRITFNKPTPEMIDDFNRWKSKQLTNIIEGEIIEDNS